MDRRIFAALLCIALLSGCAANEGVPAQSIESTPVSAAEPQHASVEVSTAESEPEQVPSVEPEETAQPTEESVRSAEPTVEPVTETVQQADPVTAAETEPEPAATTSAPVEATTAQTTSPEPVNVVIPEVRVPLSPGKDTAGSDKVLVDYSNAGEGYISVCWYDSGKRVKLRIVSGGSTYDHDVPTGGTTEYYPLSCGSGEYTVQVYEQTEGDRYTKVLEQSFTADIKNETSPFLYPNRYVEFAQGSACVEKAAQLCAGKTGTIEKTAAVFGWITENVTYDRELASTVKSGYVPDPDSVLKKRSGICYDYASLMAAMLRSQDIPTRLVVGYARENIYHAWNEIWTQETGWITPELFLSRHGYNIADATFYAGSADKEKIAGYISDSSNYSALYYY